MDVAVTSQYRQNSQAVATVETPQVQVAGSKGYRFFKRLTDIVLAVLGLLILWLPMLLIALAIRLDSPGRAIFKQERLGKNGKPFTMLKFRSMYTNAEENGPRWAAKNDTRCTKLGRILRKSRIDEFPQLINILKGDMSFVGPRPERACFYDEFEKYIPHFRQRLLVRPGLTGLAQVNGGYELKPEEKIVFDLEYISKRSFKMDISCIWKTIKVMFSHDGAR